MGDTKEEADASKETYEPRWSATNETMVLGGPKIFFGWLKIHYFLKSLMAKPHHPITPKGIQLWIIPLLLLLLNLPR